MPVHIQSHSMPLAAAPYGPASDPRLRLGFVNNMGASAFEATERQFLSPLTQASGSLDVELSLYTLPGVSASERPKGYRSTAELAGVELDAVLVTGREPITAELRDEPYWADFTSLVDWARDHTLSSVWSCLAAHAAVLHRSGIARRRRQQKYSGVFRCERVTPNLGKAYPLYAGHASQFCVPHSRWNGLLASDLVDAGYTLLSRTIDGEVDAFCLQDRSLFVFFQGHPEYETDTLLREYRRDVGRYLRGQSAAYPELPCLYFDRDTEAALTRWRNEALTLRNARILQEVTVVLAAAEIRNTWHASTTQLYSGWLQHLCRLKSFRNGPPPRFLTQPQSSPGA